MGQHWQLAAGNWQLFYAVAGDSAAGVSGASSAGCALIFLRD